MTDQSTSSPEDSLHLEDREPGEGRKCRFQYHCMSIEAAPVLGTVESSVSRNKDNLESIKNRNKNYDALTDGKKDPSNI